jgi:transposase
MPCENKLHIAIELSFSSWLVASRLLGADKPRLHRIEGGNTAALLVLIAELRSSASAKLGGAVEVACCFEADRDGFWLHRVLAAHNVAAYVLEPTSILVNRRARRAKTDRLDAEGMLRVLAAWLGGDRQVCSMVRLPKPAVILGARPSSSLVASAAAFQVGRVSPGPRLVHEAFWYEVIAPRPHVR